MDNAVALEPSAEDISAYEAEIDRYMNRMQLMQEQMKQDRTEIDALKAETRVILDDIMLTLRSG
jgi:hypothetical protein